MKPLKQRAIIKNSVEIIMRGSKFDNGNFSARFVVPSSVAGQILEYGLPKSLKKSRQVKEKIKK